MKLRLQLQIDSLWLPILYCLMILQTTTSGCFDFLSHCFLVYKPLYLSSDLLTKIHRCWIAWGQDIRVVIIPSISGLAIAYLSQSSYRHLINLFQLIASSYLAIARCRNNPCIKSIMIVDWAFSLLITSLVASTPVNVLVTGPDRVRDPQGVP